MPRLCLTYGTARWNKVASNRQCAGADGKTLQSGCRIKDILKFRVQLQKSMGGNRKKTVGCEHPSYVRGGFGERGVGGEIGDASQ